MRTAIKIIVLSYLITSAISLHAQDSITFKMKLENSQDAELYQQKIKHFNRNKNIGTAMMIVGGPVILGGAFVVKDGWNYENHLGENDAFKGLGIIMEGIVVLVAGAGTLIGGYFLHSIGKKKMKKYQILLDELQVGSYYTPNHSGITLTYRF